MGLNLNLDDWQKEILDTKGSIILCSGRQIGKSTIISIRDGKRAAENPNESILIVAPTERQAELLFQKILIFLTDNYKKMIKKGKDRPTKHEIKLINGSVIRVLPVGLDGTGIRGYTLTKLTIEEAAYFPEAAFQAITPMLMTTGGDMDLLGTPHGKQGYFYECYKNEHGHFKVFHVDSEEVITNRPISETWTEQQREHALEHIERERKRMSTKEFLQEYKGVFVEDLNQYFSDELINRVCRLKRPGFKSSYKHYLGVDLARMGEDLITYEIIDRIDKKTFRHVESIIKKRKFLNESTDFIIELHSQWKFNNIGIDAGAGALGVGVLDYLLADSRTKNAVVAINNRARPLDTDKAKARLLKEDLYSNFLGMLERNELKLLDDDEIIISLKSVQYEYVKKANAVTKIRIFGDNTHVVEGLTRAAWLASSDKRLNIWCR